MIRIVIAEDQQMLRGALTTLLKFEADIEVVAEVSDGQAAWEVIQNERPNVCLLDIEMPYLNGLELAERVRNDHLLRHCKIIIVTTFARPGYLQKAMDTKVDGYLLKDEPIDYLIDSIRNVIKGERVISVDLAAALFMKEKNPLSTRETEVLLLAKGGLTTTEICSELFLTKGTVRNYLSSAIQKLESETRQQAINTAVEKGWI